MKKRIIYLASVIAAVALIIGCTKLENTPSFPKSDASFTATASATSVAAASADSTNAVLTFTWSDPKFSAGLKQSKFTVQVSPSGTDFLTFQTKSFTGVLTGSMLGKDLNQMALKFGGSIGQPIDLDVRVVATLVNNNEAKTSATTKITVTPYSDLQLMTISPTTVVTAPATYSKIAAALSWNKGFIGYPDAITYELQFAKGGTNFASPTVVSKNTSTTQSYTQGDLNTTVAIDYGVAIGTTGTVDFRVKATNAASAVIYSNVLTFSVTTSAIVPKYTVPSQLFIVGDATQGAWNNPVPTPSQQLTKIDAFTFGGVINFVGGKQFLLLPVNGDWSHKYNPSISGSNPSGDDFAPDAGGNNMVGPLNSGYYKIIVDFVKGKYTLTSLTSNSVPDSLYIVGDATAGQWNNPVPIPSQRFTKISNSEFQLSVPLTTGKSYLLLPVNGDWSHKFGGSTDGTTTAGGDLLIDGAVPGSNTPAPSSSATYNIKVNFLTMKYKLQ